MLINKIALLLLILISIVCWSCKNDKNPVSAQKIKVDAPIDMPAVKVPDFSDSRRIPITDFGTVQGDKIKTSKAVAEAIQKANQERGGIVVIPEGEWLTGVAGMKKTKKHYKLQLTLIFF